MKTPLPSSETVGRWRDRGAALLRFVAAVWDQIVRDKLIIRASGLAYTSLLALVPLIAVGFALFTGFEAFADLKQRIRNLLLERFLPAGQEQVTEYLDTFVANSRDLGFIGFVVLIATAILLLDSIDWNFNEIWHIRSRRNLISRLTAYTSVLVFGTVLIGLSLTISARIRSALFAGNGLVLGPLTTIGSLLFPLASSFLAFLLLFLIVPATRVRLSSAAIGAAFSAVTWELGKHVFAISIGQSVRYSTLYGSLATVPIFLIWLYVTWILVLVGLEVAYTHQNRRALVPRRRSGPATGRDRLEAALEVAAEVARRFHTGDAPPTEDDLAETSRLEAGAVADLLASLEDAGLVLRAGEDSDEEGLVPARSLERIAVADVIDAVWGPGARGRGGDRPKPGRTSEIVRSFDAAGREAVGEVTLRELVADD